MALPVASIGGAGLAKGVRLPSVTEASSVTYGDGGRGLRGRGRGRFGPYEGVSRVSRGVSSQANLACSVPLSSALQRLKVGGAT